MGKVFVLIFLFSGDQDTAQAAFPTRALSGIPQDLV